MKSMLKLSVLNLFWLVEFSGVMYAQLPTPAAPAPPVPIAVPIAVMPPAVVSLTTAEKLAKAQTDLATLKVQRETGYQECVRLEAAIKVAEQTAKNAEAAAKDPQLQANLDTANKEADEKDMQNVPRSEQRAAEKKVDQAEAEIEKKKQEAKIAVEALVALQDTLKKAEDCLDNLDGCIDRQLAELPKLEETLRSETQHKEVLERLEGLKNGIKTELMTELASVKTAVESGATKVTERIGVAEKRTETGLQTLGTTVATGIADVKKDVAAADAKIVGVQKQLVTIAEEVADTKEIANAFSPELQAAINGLKSEKFSEAQDPEPSDDLTAKVKELEEKLAPPAGLASVPAPPVEPVVTTPKAVVQQNVVYGNPQPVVQPQCQTYWNGYQNVRICPNQAQQMTYGNVVRTAPVQGWTYRR